MTDSVATETRTSSDRLNAAADFFGCFQWTSCTAEAVRSLNEEEEELLDDDGDEESEWLLLVESAIFFFFFFFSFV